MATVDIVTACGGLLAAVAYADRSFSPAEAQRARELLSTVDGIGPQGSEAVVRALQSDAAALSSRFVARFTRTLRELGTRELREHILSLLVELAVADGEISQSEVIQLRQTATALGLEQADYNQLQSQYRDKLAILKS